VTLLHACAQWVHDQCAKIRNRARLFRNECVRWMCAKCLERDSEQRQLAGDDANGFDSDASNKPEKPVKAKRSAEWVLLWSPTRAVLAVGTGGCHTLVDVELLVGKQVVFAMCRVQDRYCKGLHGAGVWWLPPGSYDRAVRCVRGTSIMVVVSLPSLAAAQLGHYSCCGLEGLDRELCGDDVLWLCHYCVVKREKREKKRLLLYGDDTMRCRCRERV
jgi:hypothetical protein